MGDDRSPTMSFNAAESSAGTPLITDLSSAEGPVVEFCSTNGEATAHIVEKDPRKIARKYQLELCKKAMEENIIVCLETGSGKTHIAVLLLYEMRHLIKKPQKNICVFLAPTVALVHQQARVIADSTCFKVGIYCGDANHLKDHSDWEKQLEQFEVLVMTPQILLHNLSHCLIEMEMILLLVFDECHYAQAESNHPYAEIMKVFYNDKAARLPRIFGMTASPVLRKGGSIGSLETLLHAKVCSVEDKVELENYVSSPDVKAYVYDSNPNDPSMQIFMEKLDKIQRECMSNLGIDGQNHIGVKRRKKMLQRLYNNLVFCARSLGIYGVLRAGLIYLHGDQSVGIELTKTNDRSSDDHLCTDFLNQIVSLSSSYCPGDGVESSLFSAMNVMKPFISCKVLELIRILSNFRHRPNMKCIIFVNRIIVAKSLCYMLQQLKTLASWRCGCLIGIHSGLKNMSRKAMNKILDNFRSGKLNLLVATKVAEEGLDIQTCCLVIRFDLPETVASFIQSRGRARMFESEYAFLVDSESQKELNLMQKFEKEEEQMNMEIVSRKAEQKNEKFEVQVYTVGSTGATISAQTAISLLHHYCSKLPRDEYFIPCPEYYCSDDAEGIICNIILPSNAPVHHIVGEPQCSKETAKKNACLKACQQLHETGALSNFLLPDQDNSIDEIMSELSDSDDEACELYEMLVPAFLKEPWTKVDKQVYLNSYFIKFIPNPPDRKYKEFGFFIKTTLPGEVERMKVDLHLAHSRSVMTEFVPCGVAEFSEEEILQAEHFQELILKIILDRSKFELDVVSFESDIGSKLESTTFYLLLPVIQNESVMIVDWKTIRKCLSSPIFSSMRDVADIQDGHLLLFDGPANEKEILNSLIYVFHKKSFYFVSEILRDKNGYCPFNASSSHVEHLTESFGIQLSYPDQPLLRAKQLFSLRNLLHDRKHSTLEVEELEEHFFELPPEICQLKITGFSKEIGSSLSLLPSVMHRLENLLVAAELKTRLSNSFPEGASVTAQHVLEALTTAKCNERFSLESLEVLGDAFLKFAVARHLFLLHNTIDEGQLTAKRSKTVNNSNLRKLAIRKRLQVYIRDQEFDPPQFHAFGHACSVICTKETEKSIHTQEKARPQRCSKNHQLLYRKTIADVVEALIGAYIVDGGFKAAMAYLRWMGIKVEFEIPKVYDACAASDHFTSLSSKIDISSLEDELGYKFLYKGLLLQAFVHPSFNRIGGGCYQRLEFLGDAVLDYLITSYLYSAYPKLGPGQLSDLRSALVNNESFAKVAVSRSFHEYIISDSSALSDAIDKYVKYMQASSSAKGLLMEPPCPKVLGDLVESSIGSILLDTGFDLNHTWRIMLFLLGPNMNPSSLKLNPERELGELCQRHGLKLDYHWSKDNCLFEAEVTRETIIESFAGTNSSRSVAKRIASEHILTKLKAKGYSAKSKSLEEVLRRSCKSEPELIGWNEEVVPVASHSAAIKLEDLNLEEPTDRTRKPLYPAFDLPYSCNNKPSTNKNDQPCCDAVKVESSSGDNLKKSGGLHHGNARSHLNQMCVANCWKAPIYECCKEEGPSHLRLFTYKVVLEILEHPGVKIESYGDPRPKKKEAAELAAQGALWFLKKRGYISS